jgi:DNA-binding CsgD family transcriptional regulator
MQVIAARGLSYDGFGSMGAVLVISKAHLSTEPTSVLRSEFGLTRAEVTVAQAIAAGQSVGEIADATGRSLHTVRNQLRGAMEKTGCKRQLELALLMRQRGEC